MPEEDNKKTDINKIAELEEKILQLKDRASDIESVIEDEGQDHEYLDIQDGLLRSELEALKQQQAEEQKEQETPAVAPVPIPVVEPYRLSMGGDRPHSPNTPQIPNSVPTPQQVKNNTTVPAPWPMPQSRDNTDNSKTTVIAGGAVVKSNGKQNEKKPEKKEEPVIAAAATGVNGQGTPPVTEKDLNALGDKNVDYVHTNFGRKETEKAKGHMDGKKHGNSHVPAVHSRAGQETLQRAASHLGGIDIDFAAKEQPKEKILKPNNQSLTIDPSLFQQQSQQPQQRTSQQQPRAGTESQTAPRGQQQNQKMSNTDQGPSAARRASAPYKGPEERGNKAWKAAAATFAALAVAAVIIALTGGLGGPIVWGVVAGVAGLTAGASAYEANAIGKEDEKIMVNKGKAGLQEYLARNQQPGMAELREFDNRNNNVTHEQIPRVVTAKARDINSKNEITITDPKPGDVVGRHTAAHAARQNSTPSQER